jgi:hypothetical protein
MKPQPSQITAPTTPDQTTSATLFESPQSITLSIGPTRAPTITSACLSEFGDIHGWSAVSAPRVRKTKRRRSACTQVEMSRALRAAKQVGGVTVEITPDGAIRFEPSIASEKSLAPRVDRKREIVL